MALRDIILDGNPQLRKISRKVDVFDARLHKLLDDMKETMEFADGCGLAAPQVGILRRAVTVEVGDFFVEMVNPRIVSAEGEQVDFEACLSVRNKSLEVKRPYKIAVEYQDRFGKRMKLTAEGYIARACCHEIDHLDGILFYDRAEEKN